MKKVITVIALSTLMVGVSSTAMAHPGWDDDGGPPGRYQMSRHGPGPERYGPPRPPDRRYHRSDYSRHDYRTGDRLPPRYLSNRYYVSDWRGRRLAPPPRGHRWAEVDGRYVLVAVASGIIAQVLLGPQHW